MLTDFTREVDQSTRALERSASTLDSSQKRFADDVAKLILDEIKRYKI